MGKSSKEVRVRTEASAMAAACEAVIVYVWEGGGEGGLEVYVCADSGLEVGVYDEVRVCG